MRLLWLLALLGCGEGSGIVELKVSTTFGETLSNINHFTLDVLANVDGQQRMSLQARLETQQTTLPPSVTFALRFPANVHGQAELHLQAFDGGVNLISEARTSVTIASSRTLTASIELPGDPPVEIPDMAKKPHQAVCGDGLCEPNFGESCSSCQADCGGSEDSATACNDGCDNDGNSYTDCYDFNCCDNIKCAPTTPCGQRQACPSAGTTTCSVSCPTGTSCKRRTCDGQLACGFDDAYCETIAGVSCPAVYLYNVCTQPSDCSPGASCVTHGGATTRCWPDTVSVPILNPACPQNFCPPAGVGTTRSCVDAGCVPGRDSCYFTCELTCTASSTCPYGLKCVSGLCSD